MNTTFFRYEIPLSTPLVKRIGLLVKLTDEKGNEGWGEIAPLPGFSKETLATLSLTSPSVIFGMQSALAHLNHPLPSFSLPLCALLMGTPEEIFVRAAQAKKEGFTHAKLKIGSYSPQDAYSMIEALRTIFTLRIDVNQAWGFDQAVDFFSKFPEKSFEYIEEPTYETGKLADFPFPFALDESLDVVTDVRLPHLKALVLKPTLRGDITPFVKRAQELGIKIILSSAFESDVGLAHIACLAYRLGITQDPIGLDTCRYLKSNFLVSPLVVLEGRLHITCPLTVRVCRFFGSFETKSG